MARMTIRIRLLLLLLVVIILTIMIVIDIIPPPSPPSRRPRSQRNLLFPVCIGAKWEWLLEDNEWLVRHDVVIIVGGDGRRGFAVRFCSILFPFSAMDGGGTGGAGCIVEDGGLGPAEEPHGVLYIYSSFSFLGPFSFFLFYWIRNKPDGGGVDNRENGTRKDVGGHIDDILRYRQIVAK